MLFYGYMFYVNQKINNRTFWICSKYYQTKCKARCVTNMDCKLQKWTTVHNHPPDNDKIELIKKQQFPLKRFSS